MRAGIVLFTSDRGIAPADAAGAAEQRGFASFFVPEHTHIPVRREAARPGTGDATLPDDRYLRTLDPWVALAGAAAVTTRIELGTAVALPVEHDPITLAKTIASLDHLSGGRVTTAPRRRPGTHRRGRYDKTFAWIARSADGWITTPRDEAVPASVARLRAAWDEAGRNGTPRVIALDGRPDADRLAEWRAGGVTDVLYGLPDRAAAEIAPFLDRLAAKLGAMDPGLVAADG